MQKLFLVIPFFLFHFTLFSQSDDIESNLNSRIDLEKENDKMEIKDSLDLNKYKIFYLDGRIEYPDTSLTIFKDYKFNFLKKDNFELISLPNIAHSFNKLATVLNQKTLFLDWALEVNIFTILKRMI